MNLICFDKNETDNQQFIRSFISSEEEEEEEEGEPQPQPKQENESIHFSKILEKFQFSFQDIDLQIIYIPNYFSRLNADFFTLPANTLEKENNIFAICIDPFTLNNVDMLVYENILKLYSMDANKYIFIIYLLNIEKTPFPITIDYCSDHLRMNPLSIKLHNLVEGRTVVYDFSQKKKIENQKILKFISRTFNNDVCVIL